MVTFFIYFTKYNEIVSLTMDYHNECTVYDTKQSDDDVPVMLEIREMWSTPLLSSLPAPLCLGVVAPEMALNMGVFANGPGHLGSFQGRIITKTQKMVLNSVLLNTQRYKKRIKGKVEQSRERSSGLSYTSV